MAWLKPSYLGSHWGSCLLIATTSQSTSGSERMDGHLPIGQVGSPASSSGEEVESHILASPPHWRFNLSFMTQSCETLI